MGLCLACRECKVACSLYHEGSAIPACHASELSVTTFPQLPSIAACKQHGLVDKINGLDVPVPDKPVEYLRDCARCSEEYVLTLIRTIALRKGEIGDALADRTCYAAYRLFDGAGISLLDRIHLRHAGQTEHWAGHWGPGGRVKFPWWLPPVLQWCIDTRDPASDSTHRWTEHALPYLPWPANESGTSFEHSTSGTTSEIGASTSQRARCLLTPMPWRAR